MVKLIGSLIILLMLFIGCKSFTINTDLNYPGFHRYLGEHIDQVEYWETKILNHKLIGLTDSLKKFEAIKSITLVYVFFTNDTVNKVILTSTSKNPVYFKKLIISTIELMKTFGFTELLREKNYPEGIVAVFTNKNFSRKCVFILINIKFFRMVTLAFIPTSRTIENLYVYKFIFNNLEK